MRQAIILGIKAMLGQAGNGVNEGIALRFDLFRNGSVGWRGSVRFSLFGLLCCHVSWLRAIGMGAA